MTKRSKSKKVFCCHECHSPAELEKLEKCDFHVCTTGLLLGCTNLIAKVCWNKNEKCIECGVKKCKCRQCKDGMDGDFDSVCTNIEDAANDESQLDDDDNDNKPLLSPGDGGGEEEPATLNVCSTLLATNSESLDAVYADIIVATNNDNEEPLNLDACSRSIVLVKKNEESATLDVYSAVLAMNNESPCDPIPKSNPSNAAIDIPSYVLKKKDPAKKGKERCVACTAARQENVYYDIIHLNRDGDELKCLNCYIPKERTFDKAFFACFLCNEMAVGICHNFCEHAKQQQYCDFHIICQNHPPDFNNNTSSELADVTSTPIKGNIHLVVAYIYNHIRINLFITFYLN